MRYYIIAGEASGDLHASNLMREIRAMDPSALFRCWGGDLMEAQGGELVKHYRELAFMGFMEVVAHLPQILGNLSKCEDDLLAFRPDAVILVDYPGFNLRMARFATRHGLTVFYYISPQVWAWKSSRVKIIRKNVNRMYVILPFEEEFYRRYDYPVEFVGHPLLDVIPGNTRPPESDDFRRRHNLDHRPLVALLPGSRRMEIRKMAEIMVSVSEDFPGYQFVVAGAPSLPGSFYQELLSGTNVRFVLNQTYDLLRHSIAALVTSGTATLETALWNVPQVVCYRGNWLSYQIARQLVNIPFISLVNLIAGKQVVTELIQEELTRENLRAELIKILTEETFRASVLQGYSELTVRLGGPGASARTAKSMVQFLMKSQTKSTTA